MSDERESIEQWPDDDALRFLEHERASRPAEHRESDARPGRCASPDHKPVWADQWPCEHSGESER